MQALGFHDFLKLEKCSFGINSIYVIEKLYYIINFKANLWPISIMFSIKKCKGPNARRQTTCRDILRG